MYCIWKRTKIKNVMFLKFWNTKCVSVKTPVMPSVTTSNLSVKIESIIVSSYWITGNASIPLFYLKSKGSLSTSLSALPNWVYYRGKSNCLYVMETCIRSFLGTESLRLQMGFSLMQIVPSPNLQQLKVLCLHVVYFEESKISHYPVLPKKQMRW